MAVPLQRQPVVKLIARRIGVWQARQRLIEGRLRSALRQGMNIDKAAIAQCAAEVQASGLQEHLRGSEEELASYLHALGGRYVSGAFTEFEGLALYALIRRSRPTLVIETGVCNGFSSAYILQALAANGQGRLQSIDLPRPADDEYSPGALNDWAAIPAGAQPGWVIPDRLRDRWELHLGRSQDLLGPLLEKAGSIGFFFHDSEHTYECMTFEYERAFPLLESGGILATDDANWNAAFPDFARRVSRRPLGAGRLAFLKK